MIVVLKTAEVVFIYHIQVRRRLSVALGRMIEDAGVLRTSMHKHVTCSFKITCGIIRIVIRDAYINFWEII
jgi:hypothetical protein